MRTKIKIESRMRFTKDAILHHIEVDNPSPQERRDLVNKHFPSEIPPWKKILGKVKQERTNQSIWQAYVGNTELGEVGKLYRFNHGYLVATGRNQQSDKLGNRVTDFTKWVCSLYLDPTIREALWKTK